MSMLLELPLAVDDVPNQDEFYELLDRYLRSPNPVVSAKRIESGPYHPIGQVDILGYLDSYDRERRICRIRPVDAIGNNPAKLAHYSHGEIRGIVAIRRSGDQWKRLGITALFFELTEEPKKADPGPAVPVSRFRSFDADEIWEFRKTLSRLLRLNPPESTNTTVHMELDWLEPLASIRIGYAIEKSPGSGTGLYNVHIDDVADGRTEHITEVSLDPGKSRLDDDIIAGVLINRIVAYYTGLPDDIPNKADIHG